MPGKYLSLFFSREKVFEALLKRVDIDLNEIDFEELEQRLVIEDFGKKVLKNSEGIRLEFRYKIKEGKWKTINPLSQIDSTGF